VRPAGPVDDYGEMTYRLTYENTVTGEVLPVTVDACSIDQAKMTAGLVCPNGGIRQLSLLPQWKPVTAELVLRAA
jgi:hypothetical protein